MAQDFYDDSCEEYDDYENDSYTGGGYEWTEEDSWDALTDGMYGEYNPQAWDRLQDMMGL